MACAQRPSRRCAGGSVSPSGRTARCSLPPPVAHLLHAHCPCLQARCRGRQTALTRRAPRLWQLRGIDKKIAALKAELNYASTGDRQQYVSGIICLEEEKSKLARGVMQGADSGHVGEISDSERPACRSPSTDVRDEKEEEEDALTPPPSAKIQAMDSDDVYVICVYVPSDCMDIMSGTTMNVRTTRVVPAGEEFLTHYGPRHHKIVGETCLYCACRGERGCFKR